MTSLFAAARMPDRVHHVILALCFLITPTVLHAAVISQVSPSAAPQGSIVSVFITGSGFVRGATRLRVSGTGIVVSSINILGPDMMIATLALSAPPGIRNISVEGTDGNSNTVPFA